MSEEKVAEPKQPKSVEISEKNVPRVLLEILVYGQKKDKEKIKKLLANLQNQLTIRKASNRARILWLMDDGEASDEDKRKACIEKAKCRYYIFADCVNYRAKPDFIWNALLKIKKMEDAIEGVKHYGIMVSKKEYKDTPVEDNKEHKMEIVR